MDPTLTRPAKPTGLPCAVVVPPLLRPCSSDEYAPLPWSPRDRRGARRSRRSDRRDCARPARHGRDAARDRRRARRRLLRGARARDARARRGRRRVRRRRAGRSTCRPTSSIPRAGIGRRRAALEGLPAHGRPRPVAAVRSIRALIDGAAWAAPRVRHVARPRSRCSRRRREPPTTNVLTNPQIAAARDVVDRYAGTGPRADAHDRAPEPRRGRARRDGRAGATTLAAVGLEGATRSRGRRPTASPTGGWFLDDDEIGFPFLERVRALGPRVVAAHKGLGGPIPDASVAAASPRDIGPAAAAFPDITFVVYHSGYERDPDGEEGAYDARSRATGRRPARAERDRRGHRTRRQRLRRARQHVVPHAAAAASRPRTCSASCCVALGPGSHRVGHRLVWYGSPQPLIDAFRAFVIPPDLQARYGYPASPRR